MNGRPHPVASWLTLERAADTFSEWVRDTDNLTQSIAEWLGSAVRYQLLSQQRGVLRPCDMLALDTPAGSIVLHRRGLLSALLPDAPLIVADVRSVVLVNQLSRKAERALARGDTPLGAVFAPRPVRRHTHTVTRASVTDRHGPQALKILATLTVSGRPAATVEEIVYQQLLENFHTPAQAHQRGPSLSRPSEAHEGVRGNGCTCFPA